MMHPVEWRLINSSGLRLVQGRYSSALGILVAFPKMGGFQVFESLLVQAYSPPGIGMYLFLFALRRAYRRIRVSESGLLSRVWDSALSLIIGTKKNFCAYPRQLIFQGCCKVVALQSWQNILGDS